MKKVYVKVVDIGTSYIVADGWQLLQPFMYSL